MHQSHYSSRYKQKLSENTFNTFQSSSEIRKRKEKKKRKILQSSSKEVVPNLDMQESEYSGETLSRHVFWKPLQNPPFPPSHSYVFLDHQPQISCWLVDFGMLLGGFSVSQSIGYVSYILLTLEVVPFLIIGFTCD